MDGMASCELVFCVLFSVVTVLYVGNKAKPRKSSLYSTVHGLQRYVCIVDLLGYPQLALTGCTLPNSNPDSNSKRTPRPVIATKNIVRYHESVIVPERAAAKIIRPLIDFENGYVER